MVEGEGESDMGVLLRTIDFAARVSLLLTTFLCCSFKRGRRRDGAGRVRVPVCRLDVSGRPSDRRRILETWQ